VSTAGHPGTQVSVPEGLPWIDIVREFDAPPEQVYRAHTDPDLVARWVGPRDLRTTIDRWEARTGGCWAYTQRRGAEAFTFYGSFHELREHERLVQTFTFAGAPDAVALGIITLEALPDRRTRLVSRSVGSSVEERDAMVASGMEHGIVEGYEKLDEILAAERGRPPGPGGPDQ
jgi:uncharacterized protein YndB with AHSA1/START domain